MAVLVNGLNYAGSTNSKFLSLFDSNFTVKIYGNQYCGGGGCASAI
jgi:hypothetical protein